METNLVLELSFNEAQSLLVDYYLEQLKDVNLLRTMIVHGGFPNAVEHMDVGQVVAGLRSFNLSALADQNNVSKILVTAEKISFVVFDENSSSLFTEECDEYDEDEYDNYEDYDDEDDEDDF